MVSKEHTEAHEASIDEYFRRKSEIERTIRERFQRETTVMFTDIVASTEFFEVHGDIQGRSMIQGHNDILTPIIDEHGGRIVKKLGDGFMICFEHPPAAARAAISIQNSLASENSGRKPEDQVWVKVAIHYGSGLVEPTDLYGDMVNTVARICDVAQKGDILVSRAFIDMIREEPDISYDYVGLNNLKGKMTPVDLHRIFWDPAQEKDHKRTGEGRGSQPEADETVLCLNYALEGDQIKIVAYHEGKQAHSVKLIDAYSYRQIEIRYLVEQINQCLSAVDRRGRSSKENFLRLKGICKKLYDELIPKELQQFIQDNPAHTLMLRLDDSLGYFPWELLNDGQEFFCLKYNMGRLSSIQQEAPALGDNQLRRTLRMLVVSDPREDLAATRTEGIAIHSDWNKSFRSQDTILHLWGQEATCELLRTRLQEYDFFHYAGHFEYDAHHPSASGLLLADGKFEVGRLLNQAKGGPLPCLVFTNACQSGRTTKSFSAEQVSSLANAFLLSGIRHYIGSTIDLFDRSSAVFAEEFYRRLLKRQTIGEALRQARLESVRRYGEEVLTWASYVLYGDPTFQYFPQPPHETRQAKTFRTWKLWKRTGILALSGLLVIGVALAANRWFDQSRNAHRANQGFTLIHRGQTTQAEEVFAPLQGKSSLYHQGMSAVYLQRGDLDQAEAALVRGQDQKGETTNSMLLTAQLALGKGHLEESEAAYHKALQNTPRDAWQLAECHYGLGRIFFKRGALSQAAAEFDQALSLDPSFTQALTAKGLVLERLGSLPSAVEHYEKAASLDPGDHLNAVLYQRCRTHLTNVENEGTRARIDSLVSDLLKIFQEGQRPAGSKDEWTSRSLDCFFIDLETKGQLASREGEDAFLSAQISKGLSGATRFQMVERALLDRILEELKLSSTQLADPQTALRLGKILSARIIATGSLWRYKGQLQVTLRAVDTETTRVTAMVSGTCPTTVDPIPMLQSLVQDFRQRLAATYPLRGRVMAVSEGQVLLNIGSDLGVAPGMKLKVIEQDGRGADLVVKEVSQESCSALPSGLGTAFQEGWRVEEG
jgi:class 3 adenylate cyclase/tetratricopeptide (TPR) repeat protein